MVRGGAPGSAGNYEGEQLNGRTEILRGVSWNHLLTLTWWIKLKFLLRAKYLVRRRFRGIGRYQIIRFSQQSSIFFPFRMYL
ncbi:MAG: hypothetical protein B1H02_01390, partial [Candidatus Latescibacteria bacterium 4484_107]